MCRCLVGAGGRHTQCACYYGLRRYDMIRSDLFWGPIVFFCASWGPLRLTQSRWPGTLIGLARLGEKVTGTFCAKHPPGRSGKRCLSPFPRVRQIGFSQSWSCKTRPAPLPRVRSVDFVSSLQAFDFSLLEDGQVAVRHGQNEAGYRRAVQVAGAAAADVKRTNENNTAR